MPLKNPNFLDENDPVEIVLNDLQELEAELRDEFRLTRTEIIKIVKEVLELL